MLGYRVCNMSAMPSPTPYAISLVLHQDGERLGWRVHLTPNGPEGGYPISIQQAEELARVATDVLSASVQDESATTPFMVVRNGTTVLRGALESELADAEAKAANIGALRRALSEMSQ